MTATNAEAIAAGAAADRRYRREHVIKTAIRCLRKSIESIKADSCSEADKDAAIRESTAQARSYIEKNLADDEADPEEAKEHVFGDLGRERDDEEEDRDDGKNGDDDGGKLPVDVDVDVGGNEHALSRLADLVAETHGTSREQALYWLMHHRDGRELARTHKRDGGNSNMTGIEQIIKDAGGVLRVAKNVVAAGDSAGLTEHDLSAAITSYAKGKHPELSEARAFTKVLMEGADGLTLRKALDVVKTAEFIAAMPRDEVSQSAAYREAMSKAVQKATAR
jgi:hypothetical protein